MPEFTVYTESESDRLRERSKCLLTVGVQIQYSTSLCGAHVSASVVLELIPTLHTHKHTPKPTHTFATRTRRSDTHLRLILNYTLSDSRNSRHTHLPRQTSLPESTAEAQLNLFPHKVAYRNISLA